MSTTRTRRTKRASQAIPGPSAAAAESELTRLSQDFIDSVLLTLRDASVDDLSRVFPAVRALVRTHAGLEANDERRDSQASQAGGRRARRQPLRAARTTEEVVDATLGLLASHPAGLRSEEIAQTLDVHPARLRLALIELVAQHPVVRLGRARGVRYALREHHAQDIEQPNDTVPPASGERLIYPSDHLISIVRSRLQRSLVPLTAGGLVPVLGEEKETIRAALDELVERGEAIRQGAGRYRLLAPEAAEIAPAPSSGEIAPLVERNAVSEIPPPAAGLVTGAA